MSYVQRIATASFLGAVFTAPWVGLGTTEVVLGRRLGMGLQPALLLGLLSFAAAAWVRRSHRPPWPVTAALVWTTASAASVAAVDHMGLIGEVPWLKSAKQLAVVWMHVPLALVPAMLLHGAVDVRAVLSRWERACTAGLLLASLWGVVQAANFYLEDPALTRVDGVWATNPSIASGSHELYLGHRFVGVPRVRSTAAEPLYFGAYLLLALPVCAMGLASSRGRGSRAWRVLAMALGVGCLFLTFSRGVYLGAFVLAVVYAFAAWRGRLPWSWRACGLAAATLALASFVSVPLVGKMPWDFPGLLVARLAQTFQSHDMSNQTRWMAWAVAWDMVRQSPLVGSGWGAFGFEYFQLAPARGAGAHFGWPVANSVPLRLMAETGVVGVGLWSMAAWPAWRALVRPVSPQWDRSALILASACVAVAVQAFTHSMIQLPYLWIVFGVSAAIGARPSGVV